MSLSPSSSSTTSSSSSTSTTDFSPFPILDISSDILQHEILPKFDLPTLFSLSLTANSFNERIRADKKLIYHTAIVHYGFTGTILLYESMEKGYRSLITEFLLPLLGAILRSVTQNTLETLLNYALHYNLRDIFYEIQRISCRRAFSLSFLKCAGRSGNILLVEEMKEWRKKEKDGEPVTDLSSLRLIGTGAASEGRLEVLNWVEVYPSSFSFSSFSFSFSFSYSFSFSIFPLLLFFLRFSFCCPVFIVFILARRHAFFSFPFLFLSFIE